MVSSSSVVMEHRYNTGMDIKININGVAVVVTRAIQYEMITEQMGSSYWDKFNELSRADQREVIVGMM